MDYKDLLRQVERQVVEGEIRALRRLASYDLCDEWADDGDGHMDMWGSKELRAAQNLASSLADRIEALLPPSDPTEAR